MEERQKRGRTQRKIFDVHPAQTKSRRRHTTVRKSNGKPGFFFLFFFFLVGMMMITGGMFWLLRNGVRQGQGELAGLWSEERKKGGGGKCQDDELQPRMSRSPVCVEQRHVCYRRHRKSGIL